MILRPAQSIVCLPPLHDAFTPVCPDAPAWKQDLAELEFCIQYPTGNQADLLESAVVAGAQLSYKLHPLVGIGVSFGWAPTKDKTVVAEGELDLFQYDAGLELGKSLPAGSAGSIRPFVGVGAGARTYSYRDLDVDASTRFAGYASLGAQFEAGRVGLRLEGRDYVSSFAGLGTEIDAEARNDIGVMAALVIRF